MRCSFPGVRQVRITSAWPLRLIGITTVLTSPAAATEAWAADIGPAGYLLGGGMAGVLIAGTIALVVLALLRRRMKDEAARAGHFAGETLRLEAFLDAAPQSCCGWDTAGSLAVSDGFVRLLGVDSVRTLEDIELALDKDDAEALRRAFVRLRNDGTSFRLTVRTAAARHGGAVKTLLMTGRRGRSYHGDAHYDVLWVHDVTDHEAAAAREAGALERALGQEATFCGMLEALPMPVWLRNADLELVWVNSAYAAAMDSTVEEVLASQGQIGAGAIDDGGKALAARARAEDAAVSESRHIVMAGERRWIALTEMPLKLEKPLPGGAEPALVGYAVDLTSQELAEAELRRHVDAHAEVLEQLKTATAIFGPDKRLKFFNQAYVSLWGFDERWLDTQPAMGEVLEDLRERRRLPEYADFPAFKKGQMNLFTSLIESSDDTLHLPDGTTLRQVITPHPFGGLLFMQEDVTSSLALERNYNTLMAVQQETLDNLAEGIAVYGSDGRLRLSNPAFLALWRLTPDDVGGQPHVSEIIDKTRAFFDTGEDWSTQREEMIARALDRDAGSGRIERSDKTMLHYVTVPLPDGGVLNSYLDVTDSARVEQALRRINDALETADQLKTEFIANVSYQLRTPLNAIMGFAEILNHEYFGTLNDRQAEYTRSITDASERLLALINDILDLATIEAGYMSLNYQQVDVKAVLQSVYELTHEWAGKQNLTIRVDPKVRASKIQADERRLKQALHNLVSNAIKFTPAGGVITLSAKRDGDQICLHVKDTGVGIDEAEQGRLFGRFERGYGHHDQGVGLGLALVKSLIEMHGGRVEMNSQPGEGTTVSCVLPVRSAQAETRGKTAPTLDHAAGD